MSLCFIVSNLSINVCIFGGEVYLVFFSDEDAISEKTIATITTDRHFEQEGFVKFLPPTS